MNDRTGDYLSCSIYLTGPMVVEDGAGIDRTPRGQKARALLAMLALAPRGSRSRAWLRDKLWSDRGEEQAAASLRQALVEIRKAFGEDLRDILLPDRHTVALDLTRVRTDLFEMVAPQKDRPPLPNLPQSFSSDHLLEGIDIRDPEFEDWLTLERQVWARRLGDASAELDQNGDRFLVPTRRSSPSPSGLPQPHGQGAGGFWSPPSDWSIMLLQPVLSGNAGSTSILANLVTDMLVKSVIEYGEMKVVDPTATLVLSGQSSNGADAAAPVSPLAIRAKVSEGNTNFHVVLELLRTADGSRIWSSHCWIDDTALQDHDVSASYSLVAQTVDEIVRCLQQMAGIEQYDRAARLFAAVQDIFSLGADSLDRAEASLRQMVAERPTPQAYAWLAFLVTLRVGERYGRDVPALIAESQNNAAKALELDSSNAMVLALIGHAHAYLFHEFDLANDYFERALKINPAQPFAWDLYGTFQAYIGRPEKGAEMAAKLQDFGVLSPLSYYFETTQCINASLSGHDDTAIELGRRILSTKPEFVAVRRHMVACHANSGDEARARRELEILRQHQPDFSLNTLLESGYPGLDTAGGRRYLAGLKAAGVKRS